MIGLIPGPRPATGIALEGAPLCDLCGAEAEASDYVEAVDMTICTHCREDLILDATAFDTRAEVGLVGSGGGRC